MTTFIFATGNAHKVREIREILQDVPAEILSMKEAGIETEIIENGTSFEENALIKARTIAGVLPEAYRDAIVLADDSGLEIDALNKEPGILSARYMGEDTPYTIKNNALLERMKDVPVPERTARFVCAVAAVRPDGSHHIVRETIEGKIGFEPRGENGFGYDPIFYLPDLSCSTAELPPEEKNAVSHRGKALRAMTAYLKSNLTP
ncbi:MAG: RdgB/HAM1 family non-canonical purine NTP pyrophosphatase [Eubacterium sp.]|nr:RdgB/HAM1 family non-canonical purine NTP pyrophosphatase [Eubacterium sp.]